MLAVAATAAAASHFAIVGGDWRLQEEVGLDFFVFVSPSRRTRGFLGGEGREPAASV